MASRGLVCSGLALVGGAQLAAANLQSDNDMELLAGASRTKHCPLGAKCRDSSYTAAAYPCDAKSSLKKGDANILEFRCDDGECMRTRGLCNGVSNCQDGSDEEGCEGVQNTTSAEALLAPFDCFADFRNWKTEWTRGQKSWCCTHYRRGCDQEEEYDCKERPIAGTPAFVKKMKWCCEKEAHWCDDKEPYAFDCKDWTSRWPLKKVEYCCKEEKRGCTLNAPPDYQAPYECKANEHWASEWSTPQKDWCCAAKGVNCPDSLEWALANHKLYDCQETVDDAPWTTAKKDWCCKNDKIGCPEVVEEAETVADGEEEKPKEANQSEAAEASAAGDKPSAGVQASAAVSKPSAPAQANAAPPKISDVVEAQAQPAVTSVAAKSLSAMSATLACAVRDVTFTPLDMEGYPMEVVRDVAACQARCAAIEKCVHYSFWEDQKHCHVHGSGAQQQPSPHFLAGPPTCAQEGERYHKMAMDKLRQRVCFSMQASYVPYDSTANGAMASIAATLFDCQKRCAEQVWCTHFTYQVLDGMCHLADSGATLEKGTVNSVAGPQKCQDLVSLSFGVENIRYDAMHEHPGMEGEISMKIKDIVSEAAGSFDAHYSDIVKYRQGRRLSLVAAEVNPLIHKSDTEVVLSKGANGELSVTVLVACAEDLPNIVVRRALDDGLSKLEVGMAKYMVEVGDTLKIVKGGVIKIRLLAEPKLTPYEDKSADVQGKFQIDGKIGGATLGSAIHSGSAATAAVCAVAGAALASLALLRSSAWRRSGAGAAPGPAGSSCRSARAPPEGGYEYLDVDGEA